MQWKTNLRFHKAGIVWHFIYLHPISIGWLEMNRCILCSSKNTKSNANTIRHKQTHMNGMLERSKKYKLVKLNAIQRSAYAAANVSFFCFAHSILRSVGLWNVQSSLFAVPFFLFINVNYIKVKKKIWVKNKHNYDKNSIIIRKKLAIPNGYGVPFCWLCEKMHKMKENECVYERMQRQILLQSFA